MVKNEAVKSNQPQQAKLIRIHVVVERTGLNRQQLNNLEIANKFPKRKKLSARCVAWLEQDIDEWIENLPNAVLGTGQG